MSACTEDVVGAVQEYIRMKNLAYNHPLRNRLLIEMEAEFKHPAWLDFKPLEAGKPLADNTYNTLSRGWQDFYEWRIPARYGQ